MSNTDSKSSKHLKKEEDDKVKEPAKQKTIVVPSVEIPKVVMEVPAGEETVMKEIIAAMIARLQENKISVNTEKGNRVLVDDRYLECNDIMAALPFGSGRHSFDIKLWVSVDKGGDSTKRLDDFIEEVFGILRKEPLFVRYDKISIMGSFPLRKEVVSTTSRMKMVRYTLEQTRR